MKDTYAKFDLKADIIKVAKLNPPKKRASYVMHPKEPELAVLWLTGEVTSAQYRNALQAAGLADPQVSTRAAKALQVALNEGLIKVAK